MPIPVKRVADAFLAEASARGKPLNPYQLHKFLYLAQGHHLITTGDALFDEEIEAWENGPVCKPIYRIFPKETHPRYEPIPGPFEFPKIEAVYAATILTVLALCLAVHVDKVAKATHRPDTPWSITWDDRRGKNEVIEKSLILEKFEDDLTNIPMITLSHNNLLATQGVLIENEGDVAAYLAAHRPLEEFANRLIERTAKEVADPKEIEVEINHDPEIENPYLNIIVRQPIYTASLMPTLDRIWEETQHEMNPSLATGTANLTTDFVAPKQLAAA